MCITEQANGTLDRPSEKSGKKGLLLPDALLSVDSTPTNCYTISFPKSQ